MKKIYLHFHIGRVTWAHRPKLTFEEECDFQQLINKKADKLFDYKTDEDNGEVDDDEWNLHDESGCVLVKGRKAMEALTGRLEWDTDYDTDYVTCTDDLSEKELDCLWDAYIDKQYMTDELKDAICTLKGLKRVHEVKRYPTNLKVWDQEGIADSIDIDGQVGTFSRDEWREDLEERGFDMVSLEKIIDAMELCGTNDKEFFSEDN